MPMIPDRLRQVLIVVLALLQFITPFLFENNFDNTLRESPLYLLPAGYAFIIWPVIWLLSAVYATYQLWPDQTERSLHRQIGPYLLLNMVFFNVWIWAQSQATLTATVGEQNPAWLVVTQAILIGMIATNVAAHHFLQQQHTALTQRDLWLVQVPVAVYFGWLSAAAGPGFATGLYEAGWAGVQVGEALAAAVLVVAALITSTVIVSFNTIQGAVAYSAVIIWAFLSIGVENINQSVWVLGSAVLLAGAVLLVSLYRVTQGTALQSGGVDPMSSTIEN